METTPAIPSQNVVVEREETPRPPACPFCGWALVPVRGSLRCCGCHFTICEDCAGECRAS